MTDLYFTLDGDRDNVATAILAAKEMLADSSVLKRIQDQGGEEIIGDPQNVLGPAPGRAAEEYDDGEGGKFIMPGAGVPGRWYLVIRTRHSLADLAKAVGIGMDQIFDGQVIVAGGATLHIPPDNLESAAWVSLMSEFVEVLGVWA